MREYKVVRTIREVPFVEAEDRESACEQVEYAPTEWLHADITVAAKEVKA